MKPETFLTFEITHLSKMNKRLKAFSKFTLAETIQIKCKPIKCKPIKILKANKD